MIVLTDAGTVVDDSYLSFGLSVSCRHACPANGGGYLVVGNANYGYPLGTQVYLAEVDASLDSLWATTVGGDGTDYGFCINQAATGEITLLGQWYGATTEAQFYAVQYLGLPMWVDDDDSSPLPKDFVLMPNYPNPFNPTTTIDYLLPRRADVTLTVYNLSGRRVTVLVDGERPAGRNSVTWDGTTADGHRAASGMYLYRLQTDDIDLSRKMVLVK